MRAYNARPEVKERAKRRVQERRAEITERDRAARKADPSRWATYRVRQRERKYGLPQDGLAALLAEQDGQCAICSTAITGGSDTHVDHCHATGVVRGLLCKKCNVGLGYFQDDTARMQRAIQYVQQRKEA